MPNDSPHNFGHSSKMLLCGGTSTCKQAAVQLIHEGSSSNGQLQREALGLEVFPGEVAAWRAKILAKYPTASTVACAVLSLIWVHLMVIEVDGCVRVVDPETIACCGECPMVSAPAAAWVAHHEDVEEGQERQIKQTIHKHSLCWL